MDPKSHSKTWLPRSLENAVFNNIPASAGKKAHEKEVGMDVKYHSIYSACLKVYIPLVIFGRM